MSLDVNLMDRSKTCVCSCGYAHEPRGVYWANITHNLARMANEAGIYEALWRPEEIEIIKAKQLVEPLTQGLAAMKADPARFEAYNSPNGWGLYKDFVPWIEKYLEACKKYPEAYVNVSR